MNIIERNLRIAAEETGLARQLLMEGMEKGWLKAKNENRQIFALKLLKKGYPIDEIIDLTEMSKDEILALTKNFKQ